MTTVLRAVLQARVVRSDDWWGATAALRADDRPAFERAVALGAAADRLGYAFLGGYAAAVTVLDPAVRGLGALCATEAGGGHPRAMHTTLRDGVLNGTKCFVTGGPLADTLLVVAKVGEAEGRPRLQVARLSARASGVTHGAGPELTFVPEVPHGTVTFTDARVEAVLEGDGYERFLKPFRTVEDLHVFGAILSCVFSNGREALPLAAQAQLLAQVSALGGLAREDASAPATHVALAGALSAARSLLDGLPWERFAPDFRARFERDKKLLDVASKLRAQRLEKAWALLRAPQREG